MTGSQQRVLGALAMVALLVTLPSCSNQAVVQSDSSAIHWAAAKDQYAAGQYLKAIGSLDRLLQSDNQYTSRALPFSIVLTAGVAAGYMELADNYSAGARANHAQALAFQRKASDYRAQANHMVLQFAQNSKKMTVVQGDSVHLAFGPPKGSSSIPSAITQISRGIELSRADEEAAVTAMIDRGVLTAVCDTAGAPSNLAKASEILQRGDFLVRRAKFMKAISDQLERASQLYARNKLDDSSKMATLRELAQSALKDSEGGSHPAAMVMQVAGR